MTCPSSPEKSTGSGPHRFLLLPVALCGSVFSLLLLVGCGDPEEPPRPFVEKPERKSAEGKIRIGDEVLTGVAITCYPQGGSVAGETLLAIADDKGTFRIPCVPGTYTVVVTEPRIVTGLEGGQDKPFWDPSNPAEETKGSDAEQGELEDFMVHILAARNDLAIPETFQNRYTTTLEITLTNEPPEEPIDLNLEE